MRTTLPAFTSPLLALSAAGLLFMFSQTVGRKPHIPTLPEPPHMARHGVVVGSEANKLYLPDDLEATLWAEGPMFYNPTNIDVDARGRIWVTEAVNYRDFNNKPEERLNHPKGERVVILQDTDQDGKADKSTVFVEDKDLVSPLGIAVIGNKVIVSCAPNLVVYTDEDGDDHPDKKEILLTGFGGLDHDHSLHALTVGPDGKYYFNTGNAGPHVVTDKSGWTLRSGSLYVGGTPYNKVNHGNQISDDGRIWVGGLALRINPDGKAMKVMGHNFRNNYETALDSYGNMWQNDNDDQVVACRTSWLMEGANAGYFSSDGTRYWQADQRPGQTVPTAHWHQDDPGVMPVGDITGAGSPTGMVFYEGDELGTKYRGMLLSAEAGRNVIFGYKPEPWGAGYRLPRTDFISTFPEVDENYKWNDVEKDARKWFRPSDVAVGTDGALYIADWYDPIVGGHQMQDKEGYGRIYRITPKGKNLKAPRLDLKTTKGQIDALLSPAVNVRALGFEALKAQGDKVVQDLLPLLSATNPYHRARAVFMLANLGPEGEYEVTSLLRSQVPMLRIAALRALRSAGAGVSIRPGEELSRADRVLLPLLGNMATDPSPAVRREVAIALRDIQYQDCKYMLLNLVKGYDGKDPWYLDALGQAADSKEEELFADLLPTLPEDPALWDQRMANLIWRLHPASAAELLQKRAAAQNLTADARRQAITALGFIKSPLAAKAMVDLAKSSDKDLAEQAEYWANFRRGNDWATLLNWDEVMPSKVSASEQKMLAKRQILLDEYKTETEKRKVALEMARSPEGGKILVGLAADNKLSDELKKAVRGTILKNPDQNVRTMAKEYFTNRTEATAENEKTLSVEQIAALTGSKTAGLSVYKSNCATCHRHGQQGNDIGPELTKIHQKFDKNGLLDAIIHPSAGLAFGYEPWLITTKSGQTYYGFLISDGAQSLVIKDAAGQKHTIPTSKVSARQQYKTSLMPDPVAMGLTQQQLADLAAYLLKQ